MTADSLIDPDTAARVGTVAATAAGEVIRRDWQRWAVAVGDENVLWFDPEYASTNYGQAGMHRILVQYSPSAGRYVFYPRTLAPGALADDLEWREIDGTATLYSYTVALLRHPPAS